MTITCPSCQASYRISAEALGEGRTVRCARCRESWFAEGSTGIVAEDATSLEPSSLEPIHGLDDELAIDAIDASDPRELADALDVRLMAPRRSSSLKGWFGRPARPRRAPSPASRDKPRLKRSLKVRASAVVAAVGVVLIGALVGGRIEVVRAAPSLASLYEHIGLPVNVRGLSITDVRSIERIESGVPLLLVSGVVQNVSGDVVEVPRLKLAITAERDRELYGWTTVAARAKLAPGESAPFRARLASPPAEGRGLTARFVAQTDLATRASR